MTSALRSNLSRQTSSTIQMAMKRAFSAEKSLASTNLAPNIREALRSGQKMDLPTADQEGPPAPESAALTAAAASRSGDHSRRGTQERVSHLYKDTSYSAY